MKKGIVFLSGISLTVALFFTIFSSTAAADYKYHYHDLDEIIAIIQDLEVQSSSKPEDVYSLQEIGTSHLGNPIYAVKFSDNPLTDEENEPDVLFDSGIHANEWLPVESNINFIEHLFDSYYDDLQADHAEVVELVNNFEIWIIPFINPDGRIRDDLGGGDPYNYWTDTTFHDDTHGWRMNVQEVACTAMPGGTNIGIDLNRTWSRRFWEGSDCTSPIFSGGDRPFNARETRVVKQFVNNHMLSFILHQHSAIGSMFSNSGIYPDPFNDGLGAYITVGMDDVWDEGGLYDPLLTLKNEVEQAGGGRTVPLGVGKKPAFAKAMLQEDPACNGIWITGQYPSWLWAEIDCVLSSDHGSRRAIQAVLLEYPVGSALYGHLSQGKIGQYQVGDASDYFHLSSGEVADWTVNKSVDMNKYLIKQSKYPFSPRYHTDMSLRPEAPDTDLALVGAKISEVGTGLPGCFTFRESDARDMLEYGPKRVTWNVQNNGTDNRTITTGIIICNITDSTCIGPVTLTSNNAPPEAIETFTYDYDFEPALSADYSVTLTTGEYNGLNDGLGNDLKRFVFSVIGPCMADVDNNTNVGLSDLGTMKLEFGTFGCDPQDSLNCCKADLDNNTNVGLSDLGIMKIEFGRFDCIDKIPPCIY